MATVKSKIALNSKTIALSRGRRSFVKKAGAAMSAVFAFAVAGLGKSRTNQDSDLAERLEQLSHRLGCLEDANAIRRLHQTYESCLDQGSYSEIIDLFADEGEVIFNGGLFAGKNQGVRRLYCGYFSQGRTGKKMEPAPGFEADFLKIKEVVEVAQDRQSARAQFPYSLQAGTPLVGNSTLLQMALLQGEGIRQWWEGGIQQAYYVKESGLWKIKRLEYVVKARADYRPGRSWAKPISIPAFARVYPDDPTGPDKLIVREEALI